MKNKIKVVVLISIIIVNSVFSFASASEDKIIKVGFYDYPPYYYYDENNEPQGYYNDLLKLLSKEIGFEYEYVNCGLPNTVNFLKSEDVDLVFGLNYTDHRKDDFIYTNQYISIENYVLYTNKNIRLGDIDKLNGLKFGLLENEENHSWIIKHLKARDIDMDIVKIDSYSKLISAFENGVIDVIAISASSEVENQYNEVFSFSTGPVYIASTPNNKELINSIDKALDKNTNEITRLYDSYFNKYLREAGNIISTINFLCLIIILLSIYIYRKFISPKIKLKKSRIKILNNINNERFSLFYQPIIDPKSNEIKGFEALLRLKEKGEILSPDYFLHELEESNMMSEVSLWIVEKVIGDYKKIKPRMKNLFYISINISFKEIEDENFISKLNKLVKENNIEPNTICFELIERFKIHDTKKIQESIQKLKVAGFLVAVDDFGVEYANLDVLEKIDCNTLKLDKYFLDDIETSIIRREVVNFVAKLCHMTDKTVVCEGVESKAQKDIIKGMVNDKIYIQGYYYSRPLPLEELLDRIVELGNSN